MQDFTFQKKQAEKIVFGWKLNNLKHISKFEVSRKFNKFIPFSTTQERLDLLDDKIKLEDLERKYKMRGAD